MSNQNYPYNLIEAIYEDTKDSESHIANADVPSFYETLKLIPENERIALTRRYRDGATFKECGQSIGEPSTRSMQIIKTGLKRLRRYGRHNYFRINPETGVAYTRDEIEPYIGELELSTGTENCLVYAGYSTIEKVRPLSEERLKRIRNFGEKHYQEFAEKIAAYEQENGLTPYPKEQYPNNMARAVYTGQDDDVPFSPDDITRLSYAVTTISKQERMAVLMKYKNGLNVKEISEQVGMTGNRIDQIIQRGLRKMMFTSRVEYSKPAPRTKTKNKTAPEKTKPKPSMKDLYPYNLLTEIFGRDDNINTAYIQGLYEQIETLPETYQTYLKLRYQFGLTRVNCGLRMEKSAYQIEQLEMQAHRKLRDKKEDGLLTAVATKQFVKTQLHNAELVRENQALKNLVKAVAEGSIKTEALDIQEAKSESERIDGVLLTPIEALDISVRTHKVLSLHRWDTLHDITRHTREEFRALRRVGAVVENEIDKMLARYGLSFKDESPEKPTNTPVQKPLSTIDVRDAERGLRNEPLVIEMSRNQ